MRTLIIEADGASRGNPGEASYGAVVKDEDTGRALAELAEYLGRATNNVAEYRGLIAGLEAAAAIDAGARVKVRMDSKLVVEQMSGRWQVKHPDMKPLAERARGLLPGAAVSYEWIPRTLNKHADRLANEALDAAAEGRTWVSKTPLATDGAGQTQPRAEVPAASAEQPAPEKARVAWSPDLGRPTRLLLLRHGVTPLTLEKRFAGIGDPRLTAEGEQQARRAADRLRADVRYGPIDAIVASPLLRTLATAQAVADAVGLPVEPEPGVREIDFGLLEGLTFAEAHERYPAELSAFLGSSEVAPPQGETLGALARRAVEAKDRLVARHPRQTVLVVTHVTPIKALVCDALGAPLSAVNRMELAAASLSVIDYYGDGLSNVRCVNDTAHLD
ncbi:bifunctional RNase H/acid phosphatase [Actinospica durhamensis]|uniref:Bifunctional RNase H/acid phosphatase n=1 Tax=Actinospica durhamensis TaxID=1508375 RepID=A0A941ISK2_9ACTN|nr:bifunctional RNase H/acid phosphatase [Actinospica durhamensis]MBR7836457.1 bifunctional RNase H/acid phosphatase [Actinospica durhamensis]